MPSAPASLYEGSVEPALRAHADESVFGADHSEFRMLRARRFPDIGLALRPACLSDGDALQTYVRGLSPQSRYNRFLGAASELSASELARALAANGCDALTLLLTSRGRVVKRSLERPGWRFGARNAPANSACRSQMAGAVLASARPCLRKSKARRRPTASNCCSAMCCGPTRR